MKFVLRSKKNSQYSEEVSCKITENNLSYATCMATVTLTELLMGLG